MPFGLTVKGDKMSTINGREDEINLYDYWKVIVKRKRLIIGLFVIAILASAIISFLMPKIYRGEVILKLPTKELTCSQQFNATPVGTLRKVFPSLMFFWDDHLTYPGLF